MGTSPKRSLLNDTTLRALLPGQWIWSEGVGYRKNLEDHSGTWYIKYRAPISGSYAKNITAPTKQIEERLPNCRNRSQAEGVLMARKSAIFEGTYQTKRKTEPTTLKVFAPRFLETKRHLRTAHKYRQQIDQHIVPHFGNKPIEAIGGIDCHGYYNQRLDTDAAISTVNGEMACLKSLMSEAMRSGLISANPVKGIKLINPNNARDRILSNEEMARLFEAASQCDDFIRPLYHLLYHTGMRLGEVLALQWVDIESEHNRIIVRRSKSGEGRKIPLRSSVANELIFWKTKSAASQWLFPARNEVANPMQSIRKGWLRLCEKAQIVNLRPHDLRHNFTSVLQAKGISDSIIMAITGHKTHVMLHRYSHANDISKAKAMEVLPEELLKIGQNILALKRTS